MTDVELAALRLEAWEAIEGWGWSVSNPNAKEPIDRLTIPWNWETRFVKADELVAWLTRPPA